MASPPPVNQLLVLAHPDPHSFCASVARRWQECAHKNHQVCELRDLYADNFDPVLKVNERPGKAGYAPLAENVTEHRHLQEPDVLTLVYPVWFGSPPAMLKGYIERVIGIDMSFVGDAQDSKPLANVHLAHVSTSASSEPWLAERGIPQALHTIFDQYCADVFGARKADHLHLAAIKEGMGERHANIALADVEQLANRVCADANAFRWEQMQRKQD